MFARLTRGIGWWLPLALLWPSLIWISQERSVWPWDQAWFGAHAVTLYETLRGDPFRWPAAMAAAAPLKPPAVVWIGQFFVPFGMAIGSVDAGLLLSIWMTHVAVLIVVFCALMGMSRGRTLIAAAGTLAVGAAPLFVVLSTQYLAEGGQTLAVAWFVLIMIRAPHWGHSKLAAHLVAATSFAMLAKTTSPVFCAAPGMVALADLFARQARAAASGARDSRAPWRLWALAFLLVVLAAAWYGVNFQTALHLARTAAFGPVAELYGKRDTFVAGFGEWWMLAYGVFFLRPVALALAAIVVLGIGRRLQARRAISVGRHDLAAGAAMLQILITLSVFALSPVREPRYLEALLPLVAVVVAWAVLQSGDAAARVVVAILGIQLALVQSQALGLWPARPPQLRATTGLDAFSVVGRDVGPAADLAAIVHRTCGHEGFGSLNFVGVDLMRLSGHSLTYAAAKERLAGRAGACRYDSIAFSSVDVGRRTVEANEYVYWITVDAAVHPIPAYHAFLNQSAPVVFRQLRRRGVLQPEPWDGPKGVLLYRFTKR